VDNYYGHFFRRSSDLLTVANVDAFKTFGIELKLAESVITQRGVFLQSALLCVSLSLSPSLSLSLSLCLSLAWWSDNKTGTRWAPTTASGASAYTRCTCP
jgi:hypothetical protein